MTAPGPLIVLDDDPTGTQAMADVPVLLRWDDGQLDRALERGERVVHLITNSRALPPDDARRLVEDAARIALRAAPDADIVLRGDSTLRGHLLEEYLAVRAARAGDSPAGRPWPVLLLVPALPAAGRVTVDGMHLLERDGRRTPLHDTEYARDAAFGYRDARLLAWAEERSDGFFPAGAGAEIRLDDLRLRGPQAVAEALCALDHDSADAPAVCAADAETIDDLRVIAAGYGAARAEGADVMVRCAPTFAGVLSGLLAPHTVPMPAPDGPILVVCGSYVPTSTRQLSALMAAEAGSLVEADVVALASDPAEEEIRRLAERITTLLDADGFGVLATPRQRPSGTHDLAAQGRIATNFAAVVGRVQNRLGMLIVKGGVTSAVTASVGLGADEARVVGPVIDGVGCWRIELFDDSSLPYLVVPGNVGEDDLLVRLVTMARAAPTLWRDTRGRGPVAGRPGESVSD